MISTNKYRSIYKGYDNESGREIAWKEYCVENITAGIVIISNHEIYCRGIAEDH